jgi:alpha-tubulin suppressor-like RCC1 family protein
MRRPATVLLVASIAASAAVVVRPPEAVAAPRATLGAGSLHTCALLSGGGVNCWGDNRQGQLGNNSTTASSRPVAVVGPAGVSTLNGVTALAAGWFHTCALVSAGGVNCWGDNRQGQLGNNSSSTNSATPVAVVGSGGVGLLTGVTALAAGQSHTCALLSSGGVNCWGFNIYGQLGNNNYGGWSRWPVAVVGSGGVGLLTGVTALTAGQYHTCALLSSGGVNCWGFNGNGYGQLGNNTTTNSSSPVAVVGVGGTGTLVGVIALAAGESHTCALLSGGGVNCWGFNYYGQLGNNTTTNSTTPVVVVGPGGSGTLSGAAALVAGSSHSCALVNPGDVDCWGSNGYGQLGNNTTSNSTTPSGVWKGPYV